MLRQICPLPVVPQAFVGRGGREENIIAINFEDLAFEDLQDSCLIYPAGRFDIRGKALLKIPQKYYVVDAAIRYLKVSRHGQDTGHILENTVYLELLRLAYYQVSESTLQLS